MVREFLEGIPPPSQVGSRGAFNMDSLLREMRELENPEGMSRLPIQAGPKVAHHVFDEKNWADDFLRKETNAIQEDMQAVGGWSSEFLDHPGYIGVVDDYVSDWDSHWNTLTSHVDNPGASVEAADPLAQTASEIIDRMKDPKFAQSEVRNIKLI